MLARSICIVVILFPIPSLADEPRERDEATLREAKVALEGPALIEFFRQRTPTAEQQKEIDTLIKQLASESFPARRKAAAKLEAFGLPAIGQLKRALESGDPEIARQAGLVLAKVEKIPTDVVAAAAARMLGRIKTDGTLDTILTQLPAADNEQVADALRWALAQLAVKDGKPEPKVVAALTEKEPTRRGAAGEALVIAKATGVEPDVRKLLKDADAEVRFRVALALVTTARQKDVVPDLIDSLETAPASLVWRADEVLRHLAGDESPNVSPFGTRAERLVARAAWAMWWKAKGERIDLAKLDTVPQMLGYTLVVQMHPNTGEGEVKEFAPDGKTIRWRIRNLQQPVDAQVLPNINHVLIAQHGLNLVTEHDFEGHIHRRWSIDEPVSVQRLPDGNTFIAGRDGLVEYDAKDKKVFTHQRNQSDIVAARKDRDGTYVYVTRVGQCVRINAQNQVVKSISVGRPYYFACMELLPNNRMLVTQISGVAEYDLTTGKQEWSATVNRNATSVARLPNGNTLVSSVSSRKIVELDRDGKVVKDMPLPDGATPWRVKRR